MLKRLTANKIPGLGLFRRQNLDLEILNSLLYSYNKNNKVALSKNFDTIYIGSNPIIAPCDIAKRLKALL